MSVDDFSVVDAVGTDRETGDVVLTIADHLDWDDPLAHLNALRAKLDRYLVFIESGQLAEDYPSAGDRRIRIDVCCKYPPSDVGLEYLRQFYTVMTEAGIAFSWRFIALSKSPHGNDHHTQ